MGANAKTAAEMAHVSERLFIIRERIGEIMTDLVPGGRYPATAVDAVMAVVRPLHEAKLYSDAKCDEYRTQAEKAERMAHAFKEGGRISANKFHARIDMLNEAIQALDGAVVEAKERAEKAERELAATVKAKQENDERFQLDAAHWRESCRSAEAALDRVRALHREEYGCCVACMNEASVPWPCDTIRALNGNEESDE